jgi:hypothetical protein
VDIYLVITEDRHESTEVIPFTGADDAMAYAAQEVIANATRPELIRREAYELNAAMRAAGWIWYCRYGIESDSVRVVRRELRTPVRAEPVDYSDDPAMTGRKQR